MIFLNPKFLIRGISSFYPSPFKLDAHDLGDNRTLKVNVSEPKTRLFIGNIPKSLARNEIESEFRQMSGNKREESAGVFSQGALLKRLPH